MTMLDSGARSERMTVGVLLFDDVEELDFAGPWEVFGIASQHENLKVLTVSKDGKSVSCRWGLRVQPDYSFVTCPRLDLLIVPGGRGAREKARYDLQTITFIRKHASQSPIVSVCTGALVLAQAGILDGKRATTHAALMNALREYPKVEVVEGERFVFQGNVATSGGISAGIDISLELLKQKYGEYLVMKVAEEMEYRYLP
ncbi:MAG TPA: DJ-1/PfpI family protein [Terriglobales bacterium]|nr:DJ-1/PfpI family protein [Terriglobales bacterium]